MFDDFVRNVCDFESHVFQSLHRCSHMYLHSGWIRCCSPVFWRGSCLLLASRNHMGNWFDLLLLWVSCILFPTCLFWNRIWNFHTSHPSFSWLGLDLCGWIWLCWFLLHIRLWGLVLIVGIHLLLIWPMIPCILGIVGVANNSDTCLYLVVYQLCLSDGLHGLPQVRTLYVS